VVLKDFQSLFFSDSPLCVCFFSGFEGGNRVFGALGNHHQTRDFPMICHDRRFFSIGVFFRKRHSIEVSPLFFGFVSAFEGGLKMGVNPKATKHAISR
jgi:hypothetical protein